MDNLNKNNKLYIPPVGLLNLSRKDKKNKTNYNNLYLYNTCYINSSLQCLFRLDEFINNILNCSGGNLTNASVELINNMRNFYKKNKKNLSVSGIKEAMVEIDNKYEENNPEDANEFISNYLNGILNETANKSKISKINQIELNDEFDKEAFTNFYNKFYKKKGSSFILDLFNGILRTRSYCKNCDTTFSIRFNAYFILELSIFDLLEKNNNESNESLKINKILENFISEKEVSNTICSICKNNTYTKTDIYTLPKYLIIYFERNDGNDYIKNDIEVAKTINFYNFLKNKNLEQSDYIYNLRAVIYYSFFDDKNGHYTSSCHIGNKWYYFDDINFESEKNFYMYNEDYPVLLFYEK